MNNKLALVVQFASIDNLSGALRNIVGLGRSGKDALRGLQGEANRLKREMADVGRAIEGGSGNVTALIDRQRALARQIDSTNGQIQRQKNLLAIDAQAETIRQRGADMQARGRENIATSATILAPFILAAKEAGTFTSGMVDLQQKANLTNRETLRLSASIRRVARDTEQLPEAMRSAVDVLAGQGLDPRQAILLAPAIGRLGTAFKVDLADGANAAFSNLNNLKVPISQTSAALDIMASAGNLGAFEIRDMAKAFPSLTGQMQALGETGLSAVGNLSAALQIARKTTGTSDEAANNVQNLLAKINSPGTIAAFRKNFGVDLPAAMARLRREGHDTFEAIAMITQQATGGDLSKLGFAFEDMQAQSAVRTMIQNLDEYRRIRDQAMKGGGTVDAAFNQRAAADATVKWRAFMGSVSNLGIVLGTSLLPQLTAVTQQVTSGVSWIARWAEANPTAASAIMQTVTALLAMRLAFGVVQYAVGGLFGPFATMFRWFGRARELGMFGRAFSLFARFTTSGIAMAVRAFGFLRIGAMFLARGLMQAGMMMLANPIILAITAIVLVLGVAGYLIYRHWDTIKAAFWVGVGYLNQAWQFIKGLIIRFPLAFGPLGLVARYVIQHWDSVKAGFSNALAFIGALIPRFLAIGREIVNGLVAGISGNPRGVWNALRNIVMQGIDNVKWLLGIKSPSRVFMAIGGHVTDGLAMGVVRGGKRPINSLAKLATGMAGGFALGSAIPAAAGPASAGTGAQSAAAVHIGQVTIQITQQPGEDAGALARRVMQEIKAINGREARGSFDDR